MERKIGEIFEFGGEWYQCVVYIDGCRECSFRAQDYCTRHSECLSDARSDGISVIFKKLEKIEESPCKSCYFGMVQLYKLPYWNNGMVEPVGCHFTGDGCVLIEIKQTKEDMEDNDDIRPYDELFSPGTVSNTKYLAKEDMEEKKNEELSNLENTGKNLKPFDLEAARSGKPVCTRDGRKARIICFNRVDADNKCNIVALIERDGEEIVRFYDELGNQGGNNLNMDNYDLMMLSKKKEGWMNIYKSDNGTYYTGAIFCEKNDALVNTAEIEITTGIPIDCIDTVKITWEE